jgi:protein-disulfide isomerase
VNIVSRSFRLICAGLMMAGGLCVVLSSAQAQSAFTDAQKTELQSLMKEYLLGNGGVIIESVEKHQMQLMQDANKDADAKIAGRLAELTAKDLPSAGNPDGDVTIVEFFDYKCGYCHKAATDIVQLLEQDKNLRFVFKELPVLGEASVLAAQWSEASHKQGKFFEYHMALMQNTSGFSEEAFIEIGKTLGLDTAKLKADAESDEIKNSIAKSREIAAELAFNGTPGFIINGKPYRGYIGMEGMQQAIAEARAAKKQ